MRKIITLLFLSILAIPAFSTIHEVEVGGFQGGPSPFYDPQFITIQVGDTVNWIWSGGTHNVTSTSGPVAFASGDIAFPGNFQFVFTVAGFYEYECTRFNHAATQFGTVTVEAPVGIEKPLFGDVFLYPNPSQEVLHVEAVEYLPNTKVNIYEIGTGRLVKSLEPNAKVFEVSVANLANGRYLLELIHEEGRIARLFTKQ